MLDHWLGPIGNETIPIQSGSPSALTKRERRDLVRTCFRVIAAFCERRLEAACCTTLPYILL
jgi:hypothetical protein